MDASEKLKLPEDAIKSFVISQNHETLIELLKKIWKEKYEDKADIVREMKVIRFFIP